MENKPICLMEDWSITSLEKDVSPYNPPELIPQRLAGKVFDHPKCTPGQEVTTSSIVKIEIENKIVETRNTIYQLGKIDPGYLKFVETYFPASLEKFKQAGFI